MTHKKVNNADAGTSTKFGGNDLDKWSDFAGGIDVDDYDINSDTQFRQDKLQVRNSGNSFGHKARSNATAARTVTYADEDLLVQNLANAGPARWFIYRTGTGGSGPYKAFNKRTGLVVYSGSSLDAVLDPVLVDVEAGDQGIVSSFISSGGIISIDGSDAYYDTSVGFDGFTIPPYTTIEGPPNARIRCPSAYASYIFRIPSWWDINPTKYTSSTPAVSIIGMSLAEAGSTGAWTGILLEGKADSVSPYRGGITHALVYRTRIQGCKTGIMLNQTNVYGWMNTCVFQGVYISAPKWAGVDQELMTNPVNEFNNNVFRDVIVQSSGNFPVYGFRNMGYKRVIYDNCQVWDINEGQIKGNIDPRTSGGVIVAEDVDIRGGILADVVGEPTGVFASDNPLVLAGHYSTGADYPDYWQDTGLNTMVSGDWKIGHQMSQIMIPAAGNIGATGALTIKGRSTTGNTIVEIISGTDALSSLTSWYNTSKSERFSFSRSSTSTVLEQIKQTAGGTLRPIIFRMNDVPGVGAIESFRININGDLQLADATDIILNTTTGTKIGTGATQKIGFYGATPVVQPAANPDTSSGVVATVETEVNEIKALLRSVGLMAT